MTVLFERNQGTIPPRSPPRMNIKMERPVMSSVVISDKSNIKTYSNKCDSTSKRRQFYRPSNRFISDKEIASPKYTYSLKFISENFQSQITFNETNLNDLGIDLDATYSFMPYLKTVVCDECLGEKTMLQIPSCYPTKIPDKIEPFLTSASSECLLFIYHTSSGKKTSNRNDSARELVKRGFILKNGAWCDKNGKYFDVNKWKFEN